MDVAKAFDVVSHKKLLHKLSVYGITGKLLNWIESFLTKRSQCVKSYDSSSLAEVLSGVPQGSVLGPLLFMLFVNDLPKVVKNSAIKIFADDTKLYFSAPKDASFDSLQGDIESVLEWTVQNQLLVAFQKCNILHIGASNQRRDYIFDGINIPAPDYVKDLGIYVSTDLKFNVHIDKYVSRAHRMCGLIFKSFMCRDADFLVKMFKMFVRPLLEYCSTVWSPSGIQNIKKLETVQRRYTKRFPGMSEMPYSQRLTSLGLVKLEIRRMRLDLAMVYNIVHVQNCLKFDDFFCFSRNQRGTRSLSRNSLLLEVPKKGIDARSHAFAVRATKFWNFLSDDEVLSCSIAAFKEKVKRTDLSALCIVESRWYDI